MPAIKITAVVGARPNFIKMAALIHEISRRPRFSVELVHTGQHYSRDMSDSFFEDLGMPLPDFNLGVGGGTHTAQTAEIMRGLETVFSDRRPALVLVVGDVNSTLAAALVAAKMGIPIAHVEAGLRSFDPGMPEEINRKVTDVLSDFLFASEPSGVANLMREGSLPRQDLPGRQRHDRHPPALQGKSPKIADSRNFEPAARRVCCRNAASPIKRR